MQKRAFGNTGLEVSPVGFGGAPVGFLQTEQRQVAAILNLLLDRGVNLIDTAAIYPGSEEAIGRAVAGRRDDYILVSKCGQAFEDLPGEEWSAEVIEKTIERSIRRLRTDRLDVMLLHSCDLPTLEKGEAIAALVKAREAGKIRFAGYSGDNEAAAFAAEDSELAVVETSINVCDQANIDLMLLTAVQKDVGIVAKRPLANAAWRKASEQPGMYADYAAEYMRRFQAMNLSPAELGVAGPPEKAWPEVALRFSLSHPGVHTAIVGTTDPRHAETNLTIAEKGPLPDDLVEKIKAAFREAEAESGTKWTGQI